MKKSIIQICAVSLFALFMLIPLCSMDFFGGKVSNTENRMLAAFPVSIDASTGAVDVSRDGVENWIGDNIGFREYFVKTYTSVKNKLFGLSTSSLVLKGESGWYFYTGDKNIEIALGTYPLSKSDLKKIAQYQQQISDYYHSIGKEYILMLTPSKTSVYSEYLPMADEAVSYTPVDIVADYLQEHTDVVVYNSKPVLLAAKDEGQLYLKTDTHWNQRGSYAVYRGLFEVMKKEHILSGGPLEVFFGEGEQRGEFSAMLGNTELLPPEKIPIAQWDETFQVVSEGEQLERVVAMETAKNPSLGCAYLVNEEKNGGRTLQIYGDSQIDFFRKIPCYLAEHFSQVYNYAIRTISTSVDAIGNPDVVVYSCSERYIQNLLTVPAEIPVLVTDLPAVFSTNSAQTDFYSGMWLDSCNETTLQEAGVIPASAFSRDGQVNFVGWAADFATQHPLSALYIQIGNSVFACNYGIARESVTSYIGIETFLNTGFTVSFPTDYLTKTSASEIRFLQIGTDGTYQYLPVVYQIDWES